MSVRLVVAAAQGFRVLLAVCHVLRYTPHMVTLQRLIAEDAIGARRGSCGTLTQGSCSRFDNDFMNLSQRVDRAPIYAFTI